MLSHPPHNQASEALIQSDRVAMRLHDASDSVCMAYVSWMIDLIDPAWLHPQERTQSKLNDL